MEGAKRAFEGALATYQKLAESQPDAYEGQVAATLTGLGNILSSDPVKDMDGAGEAYEKAGKIYARLAHASPALYLESAKAALDRWERWLIEAGHLAPNTAVALRGETDRIDQLFKETLSRVRARHRVSGSEKDHP